VCAALPVGEDTGAWGCDGEDGGLDAHALHEQLGCQWVPVRCWPAAGIAALFFDRCALVRGVLSPLRRGINVPFA
jgi:hypothetical protein